MATNGHVVIPGIVRDGKVIPQNQTALPDGAHVEIVISPSDVPANLMEELQQWDAASDEAWQMIDELEEEPR